MTRGAWIFAVAALALPGTAEACRCVEPTPQVAYRRATAVLLGTVTEASDVSPHGRSYRIEVERGWKGRFEGSVSVDSGRTNCAADLQPGQRYLIYAAAEPDGGLRTSRCLGNRLASDAAPILAWLDRQD